MITIIPPPFHSGLLDSPQPDPVSVSHVALLDPDEWDGGKFQDQWW